MDRWVERQEAVIHDGREGTYLQQDDTYDYSSSNDEEATGFCPCNFYYLLAKDLVKGQNMEQSWRIYTQLPGYTEPLVIVLLKTSEPKIVTQFRFLKAGK